MDLTKKEPILSIDHATVRYLDKILFPHLTFRIQTGEQWAVIGKSGSGKTALLQTVLGKYNVVNGSIRYPFFEKWKEQYGQSHPLLSYRNFISYVSFQPHFKNKQNTTSFYYQQRFHAWDTEEAVTVSAYLDEILAETDASLSFVKKRFSKDWIIQQFRLDYLLNKTLIQLSNGETRRLLFARALLRQPELLLLDNPLASLDADSRSFYTRMLTEITGRGTTLLLVTSPKEIPECITHILQLDQGNVAGIWPKERFVPIDNYQEYFWQPDKTKLNTLLDKQTSDSNYSLVAQLKNIHIQYGGTVILDDINWTIKQGDKWALTGPNGAGKSTLLSLITGDNPQAYANDIILFDKKRGQGESIWDVKARIGYVSPELHNYFPHNSSCLDVILSGYTDTMIPVRKRIKESQISHVDQWLDLFQIEELKSRRFKFISTGEQRLVLLIRALIKNPPLLILDEPCQGLDLEQKARFKKIVELLCSAKDKTLIYVSHYKDEIPDNVTHHMTLKKGRMSDETAY